jgi:replicative DNA helicase
MPHDLEAERAVLGGIIVDNEQLPSACEHVTARDFYRAAHGFVFDAMLRLEERREPIDLLTLKPELAARGRLDEVGVAYLAGLPDGVPRSSNVGEYARIVCENSVRREMVRAGHAIIDSAYDPEGDAATVLDRAQARLFQIADHQTRGQMVNMAALMPAVINEVERRVADKRTVTGVPTGFRDLDDLTRGFQPEDLIVIGARPSMGKTSLVMNVAQHAALHHGMRVAVFSLEMSAQSLGLRLLASEARIDHHRLLSGRLCQSDYGPMADAYGRLSQAGIVIDSSSSVTAFDVRAKARRLKADKGLDAIIIDYLQLMRPTQRAENKNLEIAEITRSLKAIAIDLRVPVILLSQLSRALESRSNHRPQLSDLRDSGSIEQDSDVVLLLHREEEYAKSDQNRGKAEIIIAKQRNGPTGTVTVSFVKEYTRFEDIPVASPAEDRLLPIGDER